MIEVTTLYERERGCGFRKPGGKYLVAGGELRPCGKLPLELTVCPTCNAGIKPSRGWTWVDSNALFESRECEESARGDRECTTCPLHSGVGRAGLLWIGEVFYKSPMEWTEEAIRQGISRRIATIPNDFVIGETWVLAAHRKTIEKICRDCGGRGWVKYEETGTNATCQNCHGRGRVWTPGIFQVFRPERIEYVVKGDETEEELERIVKRGMTPVKVVPVDADGKEIEKTA